MKKLLLTCVVILLLIYALLSLLSLRGQYAAERELWGLNHSLSFIASHQESTPEFTMDQLANKYRSFVGKYSGSPYTWRAQLMLGDLYALRKNYNQARLEYQKAVGHDDELSAQAENTIAKTYELQGHWGKALSIYKSVIQNYPLTRSGFFLPMYLAKHVVDSSGQSPYSVKAYADAAAFYARIAVKYPKSKFEFNALRIIAICQINQMNWTGAVKTMGEMMLKYPIAEAMKEAINTINLLCVTKLHDYDMGINIYRQFIQKYPDNLVNPTLKKMIKSLQLLKDKKLIIQTAPHHSKS